MHKSGFVNIIGNPNVGKSTLINQFLDQKLAIVTQKAQTTRKRMLGIYNDPEHQIVFSDTPGILEPSYALQEKMLDYIKEAFQDADIFLYVVAANERKIRNEGLMNRLAKVSQPVILLINKIDLSEQEALEKDVVYWHKVLPNAQILPISALQNFNIDILMGKIKSLLPEGPAFYDKDAITDKPIRFFVNETVREKILLTYDKEIPYSVEVVTERYKESEDRIDIESVIYVERESQKGIVIGHKGERLTKVGKAARLDLEVFLGKKVVLKLFVKVNKDWRKNKKQLDRYGY